MLRLIHIIILVCGIMFSSTYSQPITFTYDARGNQLTETNEGHLTDHTVLLGMKVILQGGYVSSTGLMRDSCREQHNFSFTKPNIATTIFEPVLKKLA